MIPELIIAGADVLGNMLGFASTDSANKANQRINQANINAAYQMQDNNFAFQREMFDKANEYNSPAHQAALYRQAGLNPLAMMTNGQAFQPAQQQSGGSQGVPSQLPMESYQPNFSGIGQAVNAYFNNRYRQEEINALKFDNDARATRLRLEVAGKIADIANKKVKTASDLSQLDFLRKQMKLFDDTYASKIRQSEADARVSEETANELVQRQRINELMADLDSQLKSSNILLSQKEYNKIEAEISKIYADADLAYQQGRLTAKQRDLVHMQIRTEFRRAKSVDADVRLKSQEWQKNRPDVIRSLYEQQSYNKNWKTETFLDNLRRVAKRLIPVVP